MEYYIKIQNVKNNFREVNIMKTWMNPSVEEISLSNTEHGWTGIHRDGGFFGDGVISGHLTWCEPTNPNDPSKNS